jgi:CRP-like cAMP-binding protein
MDKLEQRNKELRQKLKKCISEQVNISEDILDKIVSEFRPQIVDAGEYFIQPGSICRKMAYIHTGVLRMYNFADDKEITLWIGEENRFITDLSSFIHKEPARWFIEAIEPSTLLTLDREQHYKLVKKYYEWIEFDNQLLASAYSIIEQRMFSHLYMTAEERFNSLFKADPSLFNRVPLKQIASMLAMTPETLSRLRAK